MLNEIEIPKTRNYHSGTNNPPIKLYLDVLPKIKTMDLELGFFSSTAFQVLSFGLAQFIHNGGVMRIITNDHLSKNDSELIKSVENPTSFEEEVEAYIKDKKNLSKLESILKRKEQHFYNCLKYLKAQNRLIIQPVKPSSARNGMAHTKNCVVSDGENQLYFSGSTNFTGNALLNNIESLDVSPDWIGDLDGNKAKIEQFNKRFEKIISKNHSGYKYLVKNQLNENIEKYGFDKNLHELFNEELTILEEENSEPHHNRFKEVLKAKKEEFELKVESFNNEPHFPIFNGEISEPRNYQKNAYENWASNNCKGIFAMATGTGKTITSLNCVLNQYKLNLTYKVVILVPTEILVNQWVEECKKFNFKNIVTSYDKKWLDIIKNYILNEKLGISSNFVFITTYATYNKDKFQGVFKNLHDENLILIADEVHNLGTNRSLSNLLKNIQKRIGLSATPNRKYDEVGSIGIQDYFSSFAPKFTYSYSMLEAIQDGFLTEYYYYPKFVKLTPSELDEYQKISKELMKFYDERNNTYSEDAKFLLIKRKRIIHKAINKLTELDRLIDEKFECVENFKHAIIYVPEGYDRDYSMTENDNPDNEDVHIINEYTKLISNKNIAVHQVLGGMDKKNTVLEQFEKGKLQALTAMKTLDEGVDIPATKFAIFCASTGNPRQYIQRRGRILRKFKGKEFATIYDLIIEPNNKTNIDVTIEENERLRRMEVNIFRSELFRVCNFLYAAKNRDEIHLRNDQDISKLVELAILYDIDIYSTINDLINTDLKTN